MNKTDQFLRVCRREKKPLDISPQTRIQNIVVDSEKKHIDIYFNSDFSIVPFREENVKAIYSFMKKKLGWRFKSYSLTLFTIDRPIEELIPNFYRTSQKNYDISRLSKPGKKAVSVVKNLSKPFYPENGLSNRNIALWNSHGWYYSLDTHRWEWQRCRLFQTVEDLLPTSFVIPYLLPMLENAGANVFIPRERDIQTNEVIVDNDSPAEMGTYREESIDPNAVWETGESKGYSIGKPPYKTGTNPFQTGSYRSTYSSESSTKEIDWIPEIPETGEYVVTIAYHSDSMSVSDAIYTIFHSGGKTRFSVNQQIGGGTWIYLGTFRFEKGTNPETGKVTLTNQSTESGKIVTADAVRFGGGMGNIKRFGSVSSRPRFEEGARYYLQYAGMPDSLIYHFNHDSDDYVDDYQCRGEWVNYLNGAPCGPNKNRNVKGLGIPIDLSLAFHTDAGITQSDTVVGTLSIYSIDDWDSSQVFPDGVSRFANRDFADILQTQIVDDIRAKYDAKWSRRQLWNRQYSESYRPNVPSALLELLSHQNFLDMRFASDPRFRFDVSRSIYKSMLKFVAAQNGYPFVVQPLPVTHFSTEFDDKGGVVLKWKPAVDSLEPTAKAEKYIVYTRVNNGGFDNGVFVDRPQITLSNIQENIIYSFKITAVNSGGESFPSEILSVCQMNKGQTPVLIINGFDRICAPEKIVTSSFTGFADFLDQGVPDKYSLNYTGAQFDFMPTSPWLTNDQPGWGASHADYETTIIPGNTFDFPSVHGQSLKAAGYSFVSASDEVVMDGEIDITKYKTVDLILGEEKETEWPKSLKDKQFKAFPKELQQEISRFCLAGGNLFLSGAYIGTDLFASRNSQDSSFAMEVLKFKLATGHASANGKVFSIASEFGLSPQSLMFNTGYDRQIYTCESPDAIDPATPESKTILRFQENSFSAGIAYRGKYSVVAFGFPFETIKLTEERDRVMTEIMRFFSKK
ncbi:MAG: xanthan lyase [Candidatus Marinimicrobia bacterium]|nr:xanthan lyase [Candidatus Neomarinimicrobiota bacterium]